MKIVVILVLLVVIITPIAIHKMALLWIQMNITLTTINYISVI